MKFSWRKTGALKTHALETQITAAEMAVDLPPPPSVPVEQDVAVESSETLQLRMEGEAQALRRERDAIACRLANLESMLCDADGGQNAILYYRLQAIWRMCQRNLELLATRFARKYQAQGGEETTALPIDKRRAINILLIAMAQEYYLLFAECQIAEMALQAACKPVTSVHFGLAEECLAFGLKARELMARAHREENLGDTMRRRAKYLHASLRFDEQGCVPREDSLNVMPQRIGSGEEALNDYAENVSINVLTLNYWDLKAVLLR